MSKNKESFFEDDETPETTPTPQKPKEETPPADSKEEADVDNVDWKAKYEAAEAEKANARYLDELLRMDDTLEGDTLDAVDGGKRYRELREHGLSPRAAYAALEAEIAEASPDNSDKATKSHVNATTFRKTTPRGKMDRATREIADDLFPDLSEEEREKLFRTVTNK